MKDDIQTSFIILVENAVNQLQHGSTEVTPEAVQQFLHTEYGSTDLTSDIQLALERIDK